MLQACDEFRNFTYFLSSGFSLPFLYGCIKMRDFQIIIMAVFTRKIMGQDTFDIIFDFEDIAHKDISQFTIKEIECVYFLKCCASQVSFV